LGKKKYIENITRMAILGMGRGGGGVTAGL